MENKTDFSISNRGQFVIVHFRDVFPIEFIASRGRGIEATKHVHEGRFSAAARAHDGDVFVFMDLQRHSAQRAHRLFAHHVILRDVFNVDDQWTNWTRGVLAHRVQVSGSRFQKFDLNPEHYFASLS